jgi:3-dehydroquinate dehydratase/shikimate dehydrogenase
MVEDRASALRDATAAKAAGADLVEYRLDDFFHGYTQPTNEPEIAKLVEESPLPCIVTCRPAGAEGGHYDGPDDARLALFQRLGTALGLTVPPRYIDAELSTYTRSANAAMKVNLAVGHPDEKRDLATSLILSVHDFAGRPADLSRKLVQLASQEAAKVLKIAYRARSLRDNLELFELLAHRDRPMIALGMGEFGLMSRVLAPKFGGFLTFASLRPTTTTAPGQPTVSELLNLYRFRSITPATAVYGVVGYPVSHSLSPRIHNAGFESINHDGVYLPLPLADGYESLKATLLELIHHPGLNLRGVSVTLPHKGNLLRLAREQGWGMDRHSAAIGAANTVVIQRNSAGNPVNIKIANTDAPALVDAMSEALGLIAGRKVAVIGAGGVARAAAMSFSAAGAEVTIYNRTRERAVELAAALSPGLAFSGARVAPGDMSALPRSRCDAYINCTPVGMLDGPAPNDLPIPIREIAPLAPGAVVMDTVYRPIETPLVRAARESKLRVVDGVSMFVNQAAAQFTMWTGSPAPVRLFERIVREHP